MEMQAVYNWSTRDTLSLIECAGNYYLLPPISRRMILAMYVFKNCKFVENKTLKQITNKLTRLNNKCPFMVNEQSNCYLNGILQIMVSLPAIKAIFGSNIHATHCTLDFCVCRETEDIIRRMATRSTTKKLIYAKKMASNMVKLIKDHQKGNHQDPASLLSFLINKLHETFKEILVEPNSNPMDHFCGYMEDKKKCLNCKNISISPDLPFNVLPITIYENTSLSECLNAASNRVSNLYGENKYFCNNCCDENERKMGRQYLKIISWPNILIINFNLFIKNIVSNRNNSNYARFIKVNTESIQIEEVIFVEQNENNENEENQNNNNETDDVIYDLYSIICHHGVTPDQGHITAFIKGDEYRVWYLRNDDNGRIISFQEINEYEDVYMLAYMKRDFVPSEISSNRAHVFDNNNNNNNNNNNDDDYDDDDDYDEETDGKYADDEDCDDNDDYDELEEYIPNDDELFDEIIVTSKKGSNSTTKPTATTKRIQSKKTKEFVLKSKTLKKLEKIKKTKLKKIQKSKVVISEIDKNFVEALRAEMNGKEMAFKYIKMDSFKMSQIVQIGKRMREIKKYSDIAIPSRLNKLETIAFFIEKFEL